MQAKNLFLFVFVCVIVTSCNSFTFKQTNKQYHIEFKIDIDQANQSTPSNDVTSCYESTSAGKVVPTPCNAKECVTLTAIAHLPGGRQEKISAYGYALVECSSAIAKQICAQVAKQIPYPITDCTLSCCGTNNCNVPQTSRIISLGDLMK